MEPPLIFSFLVGLLLVGCCAGLWFSFRKQRPIPFLFFISLITILLRIPYAVIPLFNVDESIFSIVANQMLQGKLLYVDVWDHKPPLIFLVYAGLAKIFGQNNYVALHIFISLYAVAVTLAIYNLARPLFRDVRISLASAFSFLIFSTLNTKLDFLSASTEMLQILPLTVGITLFWRGLMTGKSRHAFWAGCLSSIAILLKEPGGVVLPLQIIFLAMIPIYFRSYFEKLKVGRFLAALLGGYLLVGTTIIAGMAYYGVLKDAVFLIWTYQKHYIRASGIPLYYSFFVGFGALFKIFSSQAFFVLAGLVGGCLAFWQGIPGGEKIASKGAEENSRLRPDANAPGRPIDAFLCLWFLAEMVAVSVGGRFYGHYFLMLLPVLSLLSGRLLVGLYGRWFERNKRRWIRWIWNGLIVTAVLYPFWVHHGRDYFRQVAYDFAKGEKGYHQPVHGDDMTWPIHVKIGDYIRSRTTPDQTIYIWGWNPETYYFSRRAPATRYITGIYQVTGVPMAWENLFRDLERNEPVYFIDTTRSKHSGWDRFPLKSFPELYRYLRDNYSLERSMKGYRIYRRNPPG